MFYTYAHTKKDGTIFYIGKGKDKRAYSKRYRNTHWQNVVAKEGLNVEILAHWDTEQEALDHEVLLISCFRDMGYKLANYTDGGEGMSGYKFTDDQKKRMSNAKVGKFLGSNNPNYGKRGELNCCYKGSIIATNLKTQETTVLQGAADMEANGFVRSNVSKCVLGKRKTYKGFTFKRVEKDEKVENSSLWHQP